MKLSQALAIACLFALGGLVVVVIAKGNASTNLLGPIGIPSRCTVGLNGAAVSVQADGVGAGEACDEIATWVTDGGTWYRYSGGAEAGGAIICQIERAGVTFTVRDQGAFNLYGSAACESLSG